MIEKAKRLVEHKRDVVILLVLDYTPGPCVQHRGTFFRQGIDRWCRRQRPAPPQAFSSGAARNIEEGGSLTIIATALVDTGSRMDEVIYEEFKGTGNMEIHMERRMAENVFTQPSTSTVLPHVAKNC